EALRLSGQAEQIASGRQSFAEHRCGYPPVPVAEGKLRSVATIHDVQGLAKGARMTNGKAAEAYSITARALHWTTAVLVLFMLPLGVAIANGVGGPLKDQLYDLHRSIGALIIPLVILRLGYRLTHPPLPLPEDISPLQQFAAHVTHWGLY